MISSHYDSDDGEQEVSDQIFATDLPSSEADLRLLPSSSDSDVLTYEIVMDGEVVGTTQLPLPQPSLPPTSSPLPSSPSSTCSSCGSPSPKYRCPACSTSSCSLPCVTSHKQLTKCTGKRPRSTYIPLQHFTATELQHDLFFLEEVGRQTASSSRHPLVKGRREGRRGEEDGQVNSFASGGMSGRFIALQRECMRRGIRVMIMPEGMKRHQMNTSQYQQRTGGIHWHVEWIMKAEGLSFHQKSVEGNQTWKTALLNLISPSPITRRGKRERREESKEEEKRNEKQEESKEKEETTETPKRIIAHHPDINIRHHLQSYADAFHELRLFIRVPMTAGKEAVYYSLSLDSSINESLIGKTLIEFPSVDVVFPSSAASYPIHRLEAGEREGEKAVEREDERRGQNDKPIGSSAAPTLNSRICQQTQQNEEGIFKRWT